MIKTVEMPAPDAIDPRKAERSLAIGYAPASARAGIAALLALDDTLGNIVRTTREPIVGQMRLTWWYEALTALDTAPPPAEPVLQAIAAAVVPATGGAAVAGMTDGWEALLDPELDAAAIDLFAAARGGRLFAAIATLCGTADPRIDAAGRGWALADLAQRVRDPILADTVTRQALALLDAALTGAWPATARAMGALALLARADLRGAATPGSPGRIGRILIHRLTGR